MMTLSTYLAATGTKQVDLAARLGIKPAHMSLIVNGDRRPSLDIAVGIERETGGQVPASSWVSSEREAS
jgi:DNA-binding transcriptional regulator YdaS (Cro superfamily)